MKRISDRHKARAGSLIKGSCANYYEGNCLALDNGEEVPCPQLITKSLICRYFRDAVLPADKLLHAQIMGETGVKGCEVCGKPFRAVSNRAKYCAGCAGKVKKEQVKRRVEKHRAAV